MRQRNHMALLAAALLAVALLLQPAAAESVVPDRCATNKDVLNSPAKTCPTGTFPVSLVAVVGARGTKDSAPRYITVCSVIFATKDSGGAAYNADTPASVTPTMAASPSTHIFKQHKHATCFFMYIFEPWHPHSPLPCQRSTHLNRPYPPTPPLRCLPAPPTPPVLDQHVRERCRRHLLHIGQPENRGEHQDPVANHLHHHECHRQFPLHLRPEGDLGRGHIHLPVCLFRPQRLHHNHRAVQEVREHVHVRSGHGRHLLLARRHPAAHPPNQPAPQPPSKRQQRRPLCLWPRRQVHRPERQQRRGRWHHPAELPDRHH